MNGPNFDNKPILIALALLLFLFSIFGGILFSKIIWGVTFDDPAIAFIFNALPLVVPIIGFMFAFNALFGRTAGQ